MARSRMENVVARPKPPITIKNTGSFGVYAENLVQASMAVEGGYARARQKWRVMANVLFAGCGARTANV
jgi:hypothetical protein